MDWQRETEDVASAMLTAGDVFSREDVVRSIGDNPPPGVDPAEWAAGARLALDQGRCPEHGLRDCSPLLNGCSRLTTVHDAAGACEPGYHRGSAAIGWKMCRCGEVPITDEPT